MSAPLELPASALDVFQVRVTPARRAGALSDAQRLFADATQAATEIHALGVAVNLESIHRKLGARWARKTLTGLLATPKWALAMESRGVPWDTDRDVLTPLQQSFLALYFDTATPATHAQKLRQAGVSSEQLRGWMRQQVFAAEMNRLRQAVLADGLAIATQRLVDKADAGDLAAIDRVMAFNGEDFRTLTGEDLNAVLMAVLEVLDDEHVPPAVQAKIGAAVARVTGRPGATMAATPRAIMIAESPSQES